MRCREPNHAKPHGRHAPLARTRDAHGRRRTSRVVTCAPHATVCVTYVTCATYVTYVTHLEGRDFALALICGRKVHSWASCDGGASPPTDETTRFFSTVSATRSRNERRPSSPPDCRRALPVTCTSAQRASRNVRPRMCINVRHAHNLCVSRVHVCGVAAGLPASRCLASSQRRARLPSRA